MQNSRSERARYVLQKSRCRSDRRLRVRPIAVQARRRRAQEFVEVNVLYANSRQR